MPIANPSSVAPPTHFGHGRTGLLSAHSSNASPPASSAAMNVSSIAIRACTNTVPQVIANIAAITAGRCRPVSNRAIA